MTLDEVYDIIVRDLKDADLEVNDDNIVENMVEFIAMTPIGYVEGIEDMSDDLYEQVQQYLVDYHSDWRYADEK